MASGTIKSVLSKSESQTLFNAKIDIYQNTANAGKYLKVGNNGNVSPAELDGLPAVTSSDNGKSLEVVNGEWAVGNKKLDKNYLKEGLYQKTWYGLTNFRGSNIWTDGENIYYSSNSDQYVLNKSTSTWTAKTWSGLTSFNAENIWTDGENIYCSNNSDQYVLNKATSTWIQKTWSGLTSFSGAFIWTDGGNIYYSDFSSQYVLNKATSTWTEKTWNGFTSFSSVRIWTDGENIYYSNYSDQYVLNKSTSTWIEKTWNGLMSFTGPNIWTDGENIYHSGGSSQYVLNKTTSTWIQKTWNGLTSFYGTRIWTDGENIYYSNDSKQYEIIFGPFMYMTIDGEFTPVSTKDKLLSTADKAKLNQISTIDFTSTLEATKLGISKLEINNARTFIMGIDSSQFFTGYNKACFGIMNRTSSSAVDIIWCTNQGRATGTTRYNPSTGQITNINDVNGNITSLSGQIAIQTGTATAADGSIILKTQRIRKIANIVFVSFQALRASAITRGENTPYIVLPVGYRPSENLYAIGYDNTNEIPCSILIETDGTVSVYGASVNSGMVSLKVCVSFI